MNDPAKPDRVIEETPDTVTLSRADYEALLDAIEDAEDHAALLEHRLAVANGTPPEMLTLEEADRLIGGENPVRFWRDKRRMTQEGLARMAGISKSFLSEIESGKGTASVETLRKLAHELKVDVDDLLP
jgi:DNA-binding XRE family transcriptional regulator